MVFKQKNSLKSISLENIGYIPLFCPGFEHQPIVPSNYLAIYNSIQCVMMRLIQNWRPLKFKFPLNIEIGLFKNKNGKIEIENIIMNQTGDYSCCRCDYNLA